MYKKTRRTVCFVTPFFLLLTLVLYPAFSASNDLEYESFPETWQDKLDEFTNSDKTPGAIMIVHSPEWGVRVGVSGMADLETLAPPTPDIQFRVGSVTKMFTAMVILQMESEGLIRFDDTVDKYLTGDVKLEVNADTVTIIDLLQMKSGLPSYLENNTLANSINTNPLNAWQPSQLLQFANEGTKSFDPGQTYPNPYQTALFGTAADEAAPEPYWWYVNTNYLILGMIIEKVTGNKIEDELKERIFDRLDMQDSHFAVDEQIPDRMMRGYSKENLLQHPTGTIENWKDITILNPSFAWSAGSIISTPWDLMRFLKAIFTEDIIINKGIRKKWLNYVSADIHWMGMEYGVGGLMQSHRPYGDCRGHGGAINGFKDLLYYFYDDETFVVICLNTMDGETEVDILDTITPMVIDYPVNYPTPASNKANVEFTVGNILNLQWQAGTIYGDQYEIMIGTDYDTVSMSETADYTTTDRSYTINTLNENTTYYWKVDAVSDAKGRVQGPVWSFTTGSYGPTVIPNWETF